MWGAAGVCASSAARRLERAVPPHSPGCSSSEERPAKAKGLFRNDDGFGWPLCRRQAQYWTLTLLCNCPIPLGAGRSSSRMISSRVPASSRRRAGHLASRPWPGRWNAPLLAAGQRSRQVMGRVLDRINPDRLTGMLRDHGDESAQRQGHGVRVHSTCGITSPVKADG